MKRRRWHWWELSPLTLWRRRSKNMLQHWFWNCWRSLVTSAAQKSLVMEWRIWIFQKLWTLSKTSQVSPVSPGGIYLKRTSCQWRIQPHTAEASSYSFWGSMWRCVNLSRKWVWAKPYHSYVNTPQNMVVALSMCLQICTEWFTGEPQNLMSRKETDELCQADDDNSKRLRECVKNTSSQ